MPEIDSDTFQVLALVLLVAAVALSALALITVTRLRDELLDQEPLQSQGDLGIKTPGSVSSSVGVTRTETFPRTATPLEPSTEAPAWASGRSTGGTTESYSSSSYGGTSTAGSYTPGHSATGGSGTDSGQTAVTDYEPSGTSTDYESTTSSFSATPQESVTASTSDTPTPSAGGTAEPLPEEQPFEREGRWWYKRGDELLVYDEGSGQWEPAPAGSLGAAAPTEEPEKIAPTEYTPIDSGASSQTGSYSTVSQPGTTQQGGSPGGAVHDDPAGFWKCTSCGAINGSTAATCRMCFAAHP